MQVDKFISNFKTNIFYCRLLTTYPTPVEFWTMRIFNHDRDVLTSCHTPANEQTALFA